MSGGYIGLQGEWEHQVVIFTFKGKITAAQQESWNEAIDKLKEEFGANVLAITFKGDPTPSKFRKKGGGRGRSGR